MARKDTWLKTVNSISNRIYRKCNNKEKFLFNILNKLACLGIDKFDKRKADKLLNIISDYLNYVIKIDINMKKEKQKS